MVNGIALHRRQSIELQVGVHLELPLVNASDQQ